MAAEALLLIEVADSSLAYDRGKKVPTYARDGITEGWIVDLTARQVLVYRDPDGGRYTTERTFVPRETLAPLAFPEMQLSVGEILGNDIAG